MSHCLEEQRVMPVSGGEGRGKNVGLLGPEQTDEEHNVLVILSLLKLNHSSILCNSQGS